MSILSPDDVIKLVDTIEQKNKTSIDKFKEALWDKIKITLFETLIKDSLDFDLSYNNELTQATELAKRCDPIAIKVSLKKSQKKYNPS